MKFLNKKILTLLSRYIQINTSQPTPDYDAAIKLFLEQAKADCFESIIISLPSGKKVVVIIAKGTDETLPALAFNHHMDVVPADDLSLWEYPPFSGTINNEIIYGRGVQDMKGIGIAQYAAFYHFIKAHKTFRRTVILLMVPDEEIGGFTGAGQLVNTPEFTALNIGYIIDEGCSSGNKSTLLIKTLERRPLQIIVTSKGSNAHGSMLNAYNCIHELIAFLKKIQTFQQQQKKLSQNQEPGLLLSMHITSLASGTGCLDGKTFNIIPSFALAGIDIRIPPKEKLKNVITLLHQFLRPFKLLSYEIKASVPDQVFIEPPTELINIAQNVCKTYNLKTKLYIAEGCSDLRFYTKAKIQGIGLTPFFVAPNPHGINESLPVSDFIMGVDIFLKIIEKFCL